MPQVKRDNWKDRFDEEIGTFEIKVRQILPNGKMIPAGKITEQTVKDFIDSLLAEKVERLEKEKKVYENNNDYHLNHEKGDVKNQTLDIAIKIIKD